MPHRPPSRRRQRDAKRERRRLAQRRYRRRLDAGKYIVAVEIGDDVTSMLISNGWLQPSERDDRSQVGEAISALLVEAAER